MSSQTQSPTHSKTTAPTSPAPTADATISSLFRPASATLSSPTVLVPKPSPDLDLDAVTHVPHHLSLEDWHAQAALTRDYEAVRPDLSGTDTLEPRPPHSPTVSPTESVKFGRNRAFLQQLAEKNRYWFDAAAAATEPAGERLVVDDAPRADPAATYECWRADVMADILMLMTEVGEAGTGTIRPFWKNCALKLRKLDRHNGGVAMGEVQALIREALQELGIGIRAETGRFKVLTEIGKEGVGSGRG
ncbi:hypothetical protein MBLNU459_g2731t2 [Dothideomycetes sp. NU459]